MANGIDHQLACAQRSHAFGEQPFAEIPVCMGGATQARCAQRAPHRSLRPQQDCNQNANQRRPADNPERLDGSQTPPQPESREQRELESMTSEISAEGRISVVVNEQITSRKILNEKAEHGEDRRPREVLQVPLRRESTQSGYCR